MGIKNLNKLINDECGDIIIKCNFEQLRDKIIVIDTSIYLYKFKGNTNLFGYMYQMLLLFKKYNICPIFIFDGKPPEEKRNLLDERKKEKIIYEQKIKMIENTLKCDTREMDNDNDNDNEFINEERQNIHLQLLSLKKRAVKINRHDINNIKTLFDLCNIIYFDANGEADVLCADLVKNDIAWACLSDDTDLFVYDCPRVLRCIDMTNENILFYDTRKILNRLNLSYKEFRMICVVTGTDYSINKCKNHNITYIMKLYREYKTNEYVKNDFYKWLQDNKIITNYTLLNYIEMMFSDENNNLSNYKNVLEKKYISNDNIINYNININTVEVHKFLEDYNFVFIVA
jgi:flap endonuclease-1